MIVTKDDQDNDDGRDFDDDYDGGDDDDDDNCIFFSFSIFCGDSTWCQFSEQLSSHLLYGGMYSETFYPYNRHITNNSSNTDCGSSTSSCSCNCS